MIPDDFDVRNWAGWSNILAYRQSYTSKISFQKHRGDIDKLSHMKMPILLVRGTRTLDAYRDVVGALATHLPSAKIQEIEGTHNAWLENLEKFSLMIQEFHTSLDRPCELLQAKRPADE